MPSPSSAPGSLGKPNKEAEQRRDDSRGCTEYGGVQTARSGELVGVSEGGCGWEGSTDEVFIGLGVMCHRCSSQHVHVHTYVRMYCTNRAERFDILITLQLSTVCTVHTCSKVWTGQITSEISNIPLSSLQTQSLGIESETNEYITYGGVGTD